MKSNPTVAAVLAKDLAAYGARRCFGLLGTANFKISHALVEAGVELISARHEGNAACMGDAYAKANQRADLGQRAFGAGSHQRAHRHRRGGEEPDTAAGAGRRRADRRGEIELLHRAGRDGPLGRGRLERIHTAASAREDTLRAVTRAHARPPDGRAEPADRRAGRAPSRYARRRSRCRLRPTRCIPIRRACAGWSTRC